MERKGAGRRHRLQQRRSLQTGVLPDEGLRNKHVFVLKV